MSEIYSNITSIHVSDLIASKKWYADAFGFSTLKEITTDAYTSAFIALNSEGHKYAGNALGARNGVLELKQLKEAKPIHNGNAAPYHGFGHLCVSVSDIAAAQKELLAQGVNFKKRLEDGRQKYIAFVLDPDGYWVELIENRINYQEGVYDLSSNRMNHTMVRVKDPKVSVKFWEKLGLKLLSVRDHAEANFTLYFLGTDSGDFEGKEGVVPQAGIEGIIELTHNYGTESDDDFKGYYVFTKGAENVTGFDHFGIGCKDVDSLVSKLGDVKIVEKGEGYVVVEDPDGWLVNIHGFDYLN
ncbi:lactoylglutathione lyase [Martiniozyma asiatica (nom. inval.)]|nr:lactoylglutathione lyase [Martiniozyma asiatica]